MCRWQAAHQDQNRRGSGGAAAKSRIDPAQIPRPASSNEHKALRKLQRPKVEQPDNNPNAMSAEPATANCSPSYMRATLNQIGNSASIAAPTSLPMGVIVKPLQNDGPEEQAIGVVNSPLVRCQTCMAYMNPFVRFSEKGHSWICNLCQSKNKVSQVKLSSYTCHVDSADQ